MDQSPDQYIPLTAAAQQLGVSALAVRRRCQRGTLDGQKRSGEWYVRLTGTDRQHEPVADQSVPVPDRSRPADQSVPDRDGPVSHPGPSAHSTSNVVRDAVVATATTWQAQLDKERERASTAEQAAAMWQERARNLEGEMGRLQELLALPAHEEEPELRRRWWHWWRTKA